VPAGSLFSAVRRLQFEVFKQYIRQLLGGVEIKGVSHIIVNLRLDLKQPLSDLAAEFLEEVCVDCDPFALHTDQHRYERHFDFFEDLRAIALFHSFFNDGTRRRVTSASAAA